MISVAGLTMTLNGKSVLDGIDLKLRDGEVLGITGLNGSGKSVFLKILATVMSPTAGKIDVSGFDIVKDRNRVRRMIGYMPDSSDITGKLTVREYLGYYSSLYRVKKKDFSVSFDRLTRAFDISVTDREYLSDQSHGLKQKVSLLRSVMHDPSVLLLDNPESGMDWKGVDNLTSFVKNSGNEGKTIIVASHSVSLLNSLAHRIGVFHDAKLRWLFPAGVESQDSIHRRMEDLKKGSHERPAE
jgi:ABC-type multidrug transport system ATPase subunit